MSNSVFPSLPGLTWGTTKTPEWKTIVQESVSGKELAASLMTYPRWTYTLSYEFLRSGAQTELQTLVGFFNARRGKFDDFLYTDPDDNAVTSQQFGTGDGTSTVFALVRTYGGFTEPVQNINGTPSVYKTDWQGTQLQYTTPRTNLLLQSSTFDNSAWTKSGAIAVTANASTAPDGTITADSVNDTDTANPALISEQTSASYPAGTQFACSIYIKQGTSTKSTFNCYATGDTETNAFVTWSGGVPSVTLGTLTSMGSGWYRWTIVVTSGVTGTFNYRFWPTDRASSSLTGSIYLWGAQCEISATSTSYIATTIATVTVTDYSLSSLGVATFSPAPASGAVLTWTGSYYWRVRFLQDSSEFTNFMQQLYSAKKISFKTVKL
jgi:hypothetical protein